MDSGKPYNPEAAPRRAARSAPGVALAALLLAMQVCAGAAVPAEPTGSPGAQDVIAELSHQLFAELARESAAFRSSGEKALPLIDRLLAPHFDAGYSARLVLGRHWNEASPTQRQAFAAAFYQTLLRTYAGAVAAWTPERFRLLPASGDPAALQVTVRTLVTSPGGAVTPVDYRLRLTPEGWKIFDVVVEGVSYDRSYRDDVDADVSRNGLDFVIARLSRRPGQR